MARFEQHTDTQDLIGGIQRRRTEGRVDGRLEDKNTGIVVSESDVRLFDDDTLLDGILGKGRSVV